MKKNDEGRNYWGQILIKEKEKMIKNIYLPI
jgi:hypothetical protein